MRISKRYAPSWAYNRGQSSSVTAGRYQAKRLGFLIEACERVRASGIDLHLAIVGDGPEKQSLERISYEVPRLDVVGSAHGERKALFLSLAECMAIPGVVGLAVVDAFAHECPLVTTDIPGHGPEIEYLVDGVNGLKSFKTASINLLGHGSRAHQ